MRMHYPLLHQKRHRARRHRSCQCGIQPHRPTGTFLQDSKADPQRRLAAHPYHFGGGDRLAEHSSLALSRTGRSTEIQVGQTAVRLRAKGEGQIMLHGGLQRIHIRSKTRNIGTPHIYARHPLGRDCASRRAGYLHHDPYPRLYRPLRCDNRLALRNRPRIGQITDYPRGSHPRRGFLNPHPGTATAGSGDSGGT